MLSLLKSVPILGTAVTFVTDNIRLVIEYVLIAIVVTLCGVAVALWGAKQKSALALAQTQTSLETVASRLATVESVNQGQEATILDLKELRSKDAKAIDGLLGDYKDLSDNDTKVRTRLQTLENSNAAVRDYLNQPVPAELACLLDNTCTATGDQGSDKNRASRAPANTHGKVRSTGKPPTPNQP